MQAVILVAGNSTRMHPLSANKHKSLLKFAGKRVLEHQLCSLEGTVDEVILVVSKLGGEIESVFGSNYNSLSLKYVVQAEPKGTLHAVQCAEHLLKGQFIVLMGDDLYGKTDLALLAKQKYGVLACEVPNPSQYGVIVVDNELNLVDIIEKPVVPLTNLVSTGAFVLNIELFKFASKVLPSHRGEIELGDAVKLLSKHNAVKIVRVEEYWKGCSYPWDLLSINEFLLAKESARQVFQGGVVIEENVSLKGFVSVGEGTIIKSGSYVEGPVILGKNCTIGPNAHIKGATFICDDCVISFGAQVCNSIVGRASVLCHHAAIADSVVGEKVVFNSLSSVSNSNFDLSEVTSVYKSRPIGSSRKNFGAVVGDNVIIGAHAVILPGRKLWPGCFVSHNEVVYEDKVL